MGVRPRVESGRGRKPPGDLRKRRRVAIDPEIRTKSGSVLESVRGAELWLRYLQDRGGHTTGFEISEMEVQQHTSGTWPRLRW